jgi:hypothetical protein
MWKYNSKFLCAPSPLLNYIKFVSYFNDTEGRREDSFSGNFPHVTHFVKEVEKIKNYWHITQNKWFGEYSWAEDDEQQNCLPLSNELDFKWTFLCRQQNLNEKSVMSWTVVIGRRRLLLQMQWRNALISGYFYTIKEFIWWLIIQVWITNSCLNLRAFLSQIRNNIS